MINKIKKIFLSRACWSASILMLAVFGFYFLNQSFLPAQAELSRPRTKAELRAFVKSDFPKGMTQKIRGSLTVKIKSLSEFAPNQPVVYVAEVFADSALSHADYKWILPGGMELVQGELQGTLTDIKAEVATPVEITLKSVIDENQQLHFHITGDDGGANFTAADQYNTKDQAEINVKIQELHEKTKKASKKQALQ